MMSDTMQEAIETILNDAVRKHVIPISENSVGILARAVAHGFLAPKNQVSADLVSYMHHLAACHSLSGHTVGAKKAMAEAADKIEELERINAALVAASTQP